MNSQFRTGQENWNDTISIFQQAELNWYLSAKDTLQQAVTSPNGETQYQTNAIPQTNQLQTQITNSKQTHRTFTTQPPDCIKRINTQRQGNNNATSVNESTKPNELESARNQPFSEYSGFFWKKQKPTKQRN
nr:hypothetical protein [Leptospira borgpetersenii]